LIVGLACTMAAAVLVLVLLAAASRRVILAYAAVRLYRPAEQTQAAPDFWIVCACRNEAKRLPRLIATLGVLPYRGRYRVVLIDDASADATPALMAEAGRTNPERLRAILLTGAQNGKADALHKGLAKIEMADDDLLLVIDADHRLAADALNHLANYFADPDIAAVSIEHPVEAPERSLVSAYCYLEAAVSEVVTSRGQHSLGLAPKLAGSWACRPRAFHDLYPHGGQMADDTVFTAAIVASGGRVAYAADVRALQDVPETVEGYLAQHVRWAAGYAESAVRSVAARAHQKGPLQTIDAIATHAGYFERPLLLGLLALAAVGWAFGSKGAAICAAGVIGVYFAVIAVQIGVALRLSGASTRLVLMSLAALPMLAIDLAVSLRGAAAGLTGRKVSWSVEHRG
jgi:cellulose synthase/poly-beta-1,6-N-acetylglucosamine synthase-like glycosyltransferase